MRVPALSAVLVALISSGAIPAVPQDALDPQADAIAAWQAAAAPGPGHEALNVMIGEWRLEGRHRMAPTAEWSPITATSSVEWVLGGRFQRQVVHGDPSETVPQPYEGLYLLGYDNLRKRYDYIYLDNYTTAMNHYTGSFDEAAGILALNATILDPMSGQEKPAKASYTFRGKDELLYRDYGYDDQGNEFVAIEITYTRSDSDSAKAR